MHAYLLLVVASLAGLLVTLETKGCIEYRIAGKSPTPHLDMYTPAPLGHLQPGHKTPGRSHSSLQNTSCSTDAESLRVPCLLSDRVEEADRFSLGPACLRRLGRRPQLNRKSALSATFPRKPISVGFGPSLCG
jgi:hypothetical protein